MTTGIPPNMSLAAAISCGLIPRSLQLTGYGAGLPSPTIASLTSDAGSSGTGSLSPTNAGSGGSNDSHGTGRKNTVMKSMNAVDAVALAANPPQMG
jgi:hypothetical protein